MKRGFTLIELMVVISIISLLSSIVFSSVITSRDRAVIAAGLQFENQVHKKLYNCLVAQYDFETTIDSELGIDSSGYGNHGTNYGAASVAGINGGRAAEFAGTDFIRILNNDQMSSMDNLTITSWVKWDGGGSDNMIINKEGSAYEYRVRNGFVNLATNSWTWRGGVSSPVSANEWSHVLISHEYPGRQKIFIDGVQTFQSNSNGAKNQSLDNITIGARSDGGSSHFGGVIDNVRIYNCAL